MADKEVKVASLGKVERIPMNFKQDNAGEQQQTNEGGEGADKSKTNENNQTAAAQAKPEINDDVLKEYFKSKGIDYEGEEKLKEKLNFKPEQALTDADKEKIALAQEKRRMDLYVANGGKIEEYVEIKRLAAMDLNQLSLSAAKQELKDGGFTDEQIDVLLKERYYQYDEEEIEQTEDESDKAFKKRQKEFFAAKLAKKGNYIQNLAKEALINLNSAIESEDLQAQNENTTSANIDEAFKKLPRTITFEIGEINGKTISPVEAKVSDEDYAEIYGTLKDPGKRKQLLLNQDGSLNLDKIAEVFTENILLKSAAKATYFEGQTRANAEWEKTFGARNPNELGVGGNNTRANNTSNGKVASFGKSQRVQPSTA